jgi:hypothetical protein
MTRAQLHWLVWEVLPVEKLAHEWGLTASGLRRLCLRNQVPVPSYGYWQFGRRRMKRKAERSFEPLKQPAAQVEFRNIGLSYRVDRWLKERSETR